MAYWWAPGIVSMPSMEVGSGTRGGYARVSWGKIEFAPNAFANEPPAQADIEFDWGLDSANLLHLFDGALYRRGYDNRRVSYDLYEPGYATKLLDEGVDEQGNDCVRPLVVGTVTHMIPQRTEPDTGQKYYMPDFALYDFYDDGVLINDNWTIGGGYAERSVNLVGSLSMSGSGNMATLADVFDWACGRLGLSFNNIHGGDVPLNCVIYGQQLLIDFLDKIAWYCGRQFTVLGGELTLIDMTQDNGDRALGRFDSLDLSYSWPMPIKSYKAEWSVREFDAATVSLISVDRKAEYFTGQAIGDEKTIDVYDETVSDVNNKILAIAAQEALVSISINLPLDQIPQIGERIDFEDRKKAHDISGHLRVRSYSIDYREKVASIHGDGAVVFS
jgi:hypothetical protein